MNTSYYAGFRWRLLASLIDIILISLIIFPLLTLVYGMDYWLGDYAVYGVWDIVLNYILPVVVTIWFWRRFLGTPGKMICKLRVVDAHHHQPLTIKQSIIRYVSYILSTLPLCAGFFWIIFDKQKQGWHDKLAGSVVIRGDIEEDAELELDALDEQDN